MEEYRLRAFDNSVEYRAGLKSGPARQLSGAPTCKWAPIRHWNNFNIVRVSVHLCDIYIYIYIYIYTHTIFITNNLNTKYLTIDCRTYFK